MAAERKTEQEHIAPRHSNAYAIFILVLTLMSLGIMVLLLLPIDQGTRDLLNAYDNLICVVFLIDFAQNLLGTRPRSDYFIRRRGWLDLLGSIPSFGIFQFTVLLRLARLSRLARISRLLGGQNKKALVDDLIANRGQYAAFFTLLLAFMVLVVSSVLVLQFESKNPDANITTGGDALWWAVVTITTVGYGDRYPITALGRLTAVGVMFAGVGIIGALASILASLLVPSPKEVADANAAAAADDAGGGATRATGAAGVAAPSASVPGTAAIDPGGAAGIRDVATELAALRAEMAALRATVEGSISRPD
jgi:voltage-gated potassium channel